MRQERPREIDLCRGHKDEKGISGLETAIILTAFVVVATVFSSAILSAGTVTTQQGQGAINDGLSEVRGTMVLRGGIMAQSNPTQTEVMTLTFTVTNIGGGVVNLTPPPDHRMVIDYSDETQRQVDLEWTRTWLGTDDGDDLLEQGEMAEITVPLDTLPSSLAANTKFALQVKSERGAAIVLERRTPVSLDLVMDLK